MAKNAKGLTPKQEAFALAFFETSNAAEAYRRAYDVAPDAKDQWLYVEASQLLDHPNVSLRLQELEDQAAALSLYTRQKALQEYEEARSLALKEGAASAAVSATTGKVKLFGLEAPTKTKTEVTGKDGGAIETKDVSDVELARQVAFMLAAAVKENGDAD